MKISHNTELVGWMEAAAIAHHGNRFSHWKIGVGKCWMERRDMN